MRVNGQEYRLKLNECCIDHCRDWAETHEGKYPPSDHSPGCKNFKLEKFAKIKDPEGGIMLAPEAEQSEALEMVKECWPDNQDKVVIAGYVMLTDDQVERMREYEP